MTDFYIEVISNSTYIINSLSEFKNKIQLLHPLEGNWEVGLSEISYTKSWYNVPYNVTIGVGDEKNEPTIDTNAHDYVAINKRSGTLKRGYYKDVPTLVDEINKEIEAYKGSFTILPKLFYDEVATKQVFILPGEDKSNHIVLPLMDLSLREMLGFHVYNRAHPMVNKQGIMQSQAPADITMGIRHILVYCNLILPQYVGDSRTKLLRSVDIPNDAEFGDQITLNFDNPHYVPLLCNEFDEIEINIRDDMGQFINFKFGRTRVKLHFRQI